MAIEGETQRRALYEQFLRCIDREENLIHYRLTWVIQWNAAIVAAIVATSQFSLLPSLEISIKIIFSVLGASLGWFCYIGVKAAFDQSNYLIQEVENRLGIKGYTDGKSHHPLEKDWESSEFLRPFGQQGTVHVPARNAAIKFPILFIGIWGVFLIYTVLRAFDRLEWIIVPALR